MTALRWSDDEQPLERQLADDIVWGVLSAGSVIDVAGLAALYNVSEWRLRDALDNLTRAGLVVEPVPGELKIAPLNKHVARMTIDRWNDVTQQVLSNAEGFIGELDSDAVQQLVTKMRKDLACGDRMKLAEHIAEFHMRINEACGDETLTRRARETNLGLMRVFAQAINDGDGRMIDGMQRGAEAIADGNAEGLRQLYKMSYAQMRAAIDSTPDHAWPRS
jgi:DNA-binding GntR family transcriptional regulator